MVVPKTRAGHRQIGLPRKVVDELERHIEDWASESQVFTNPKGGPLRPVGWRNRFWNPAAKKADFADLTPHDLRHTAVSLWIAAGANPKEVARRAGHASVSFTLDRYGHLFPGYDQELRERLDDIFEPPE